MPVKGHTRMGLWIFACNKERENESIRLAKLALNGSLITTPKSFVNQELMQGFFCRLQIHEPMLVATL